MNELGFEPQLSATWSSSADYEVYIDYQNTDVHFYSVKLEKLENVGWGNKVDTDSLEAS